LKRGFVSRCIGGLLRGFWFFCQILLVAWAILAIYYSNLPWAELRLALAIAFAAFAIWALWFSRQRRMSAAAFICSGLRIMLRSRLAHRLLHSLAATIAICTLPRRRHQF